MANEDRKGSKGTPWWKDHEQLAFVFERALRPFEDVRKNTRQRDLVGLFRQMDVGVAGNAQDRLSGLVEIQKRARKVGIEQFGSWMYKMQTLPARELVGLSEARFTRGVFEHVRKLHPKSVRLARIYEVPNGQLPDFDSKLQGLMSISQGWYFAGVFVQSCDDDITTLPLHMIDPREKIFVERTGQDSLSLMDVVQDYGGIAWQPGRFHAPTYVLDGQFSWNDIRIKRLMLCVEYQRSADQVENRFFAYDEDYPSKRRRGLCLVARFLYGGQPMVAETVVVPSESGAIVTVQVNNADDVATAG